MPATLTSLRIRNLALVESLDWSLAPGFTAITGETGSGKSVILGALKLILGERADKTLIRSGSDQCSVEATFSVDDSTPFNASLDVHGIDACTDGQLLIKRIFSASGTNRQFINSCATTLNVLKDLGDNLVDLHGPHDHQSLLAQNTQLDLLDAFAASAPARSACSTAYRTLRQFIEERDSLAASEGALERELDLLRHQADEIATAALRAEDEEETTARWKTAANSRKLIETAQRIVQGLAESEDAALVRLGEMQRLWRELERLDPSRTADATQFAEAVAALETSADYLQRYIATLDIDPAQLVTLEERVTLIETLKRKYGGTIASVIAHGQNATERLRKIESRSDELTRLAAAIKDAEEKLNAAAATLTARRKKTAPKLATAIQEQLRALGFQRSGFTIELLPLPSPAASGGETVELLFAPNPGEPAKPLRMIGSSGEISRVMLAVKTALATVDQVPLMVFDEIDANVGGEIAHAVADKMKSLGARHQVLCITHLPQVAAAASHHFVVSKEFKNDRTLSTLLEVTGNSRTEEIARMLGGKSESALALAKNLLK